MAAPEHPVELAAAEDIAIEGDGERLRQALENLVANAVQHSPRDVPVLVG